jgi:hypothetical protein
MLLTSCSSIEDARRPEVGCGPERTYSDEQILGTLRPGGEPAGALSPLALIEHRIEIGLPRNWVVTLVSENDPRYGELETLCARGPRDSVSGLGYTEVRLLIARSGSIIRTFDDFARERLLDYRTTAAPVPSWSNVTLGGSPARRTVVAGTKLVPPTGVDPRAVPTKTTIFITEKNGFFYDFSLSGSSPDHDRFASLFESILGSVRFR